MLACLFLLAFADAPTAELVSAPIPAWVETYFDRETRQRELAVQSWKDEIALARQLKLPQRVAEAQRQLKSLPQTRVIPWLPTPFLAGTTGEFQFAEVRVDSIRKDGSALVTLRHFVDRSVQPQQGVTIPLPAETHDTPAELRGVDTTRWTIGSWQPLPGCFQLSADDSGRLIVRPVNLERDVEPYRRQWESQQKRVRR